MQTLNFVVVGDIRSGTTPVQTGINNREGVACHGDLFHPSIETRQEAHEAYYGPAREPVKFPEWFLDTVNPCQYINSTVFDNPMFEEQAVGLRILYDVIRRWELWEFFADKYREGDFCLIHVLRNPVACFVSLQQAIKSGIWVQRQNEHASRPLPASLDAGELIEFCRQHTTMRQRLKAACHDSLEIQYRDLFLDYDRVMHRVFDFLELPFSERAAVAGCRRLRNRPIRERISNFDKLRNEVTSEVRSYMDAEDLF
jgi:hypothetical protein